MEGHQQNWKVSCTFFGHEELQPGSARLPRHVLENSFFQWGLLHSFEVRKFTVIDVIMQANPQILAEFKLLKRVQNFWANIRIYLKVPKLTYLEVHKRNATTKNCKLYSILPLVATGSLFSELNEFCTHNPLYCFSIVWLEGTTQLHEVCFKCSKNCNGNSWNAQNSFWWQCHG